MSSDFNYNHEREVEQLRIAIEFHLKKIREIGEYIEKLEEARAPGTGKTDESYQVIKLYQKKQIHEDRIREIASRIHGLKTEAEKEARPGRGYKLSLVTGETGAGTTTSSISIAERDENPIISNLESLEDAFHADSWGEVEAILEDHPDQQFTILIDEYAGIEDGHEFVQEMLKQRHHVILVKPHPEEFHPWAQELADSEYYISERGINGIFPPRRSFDTCEIPHFDFTKPPQAYPRVEFEDDAKDDLTQVSGVCEDEEQILNAGGYETIEDLREATQRDLANIRIGNALAARIKADVGDAEPEEDDEPSFAEFFGLTQEEADAARNAAEQFAAGEFEDDEDELTDDLFSPDERFPPQFHLDNLESKLDFNLGEVDGFFKLDWSSKCDLAKIAVENDLGLETTETIVQMSLASAGDESC
jgi:hypothetical protein